MLDDLKIYGIISILLLLVLGYFVYINYRDTMILKNEVKELKEFFNTECLDDEESSEGSIEEHQFTDIDEYFSHVKEQMPLLHELQEAVEPPAAIEPEIQEVCADESAQKKKKQRKQKKKEETTALVISPVIEETQEELHEFDV
jgi:hypothetical protein